jgi:hypothetical protein
MQAAINPFFGLQILTLLLEILIKPFFLAGDLVYRLGPPEFKRN